MGTGAEAIKKAIAEKPDVIMLDLELPDMEGAKGGADSKKSFAYRNDPDCWLDRLYRY